MTLEAFQGPFPLYLLGKRIAPPIRGVNRARDNVGSRVFSLQELIIKKRAIATARTAAP